MSAKVKVVLHVSAGGETDRFYGNHGVLFHEYEKVAGGSIEFVSFGGYIDPRAAEGERFLGECRNADVVILDAWNHGVGSVEECEDREAFFAQRIRDENPLATIFAELMEGVRKVAVHEFATSFADFTDSEILAAIKMAAQKNESLPFVLVMDDTEYHRKAALNQLTGVRLALVGDYERAEKLIQKHNFNAVLLDLMVPAPARTQGPEGMKFVGREMPLGIFLAMLALKRGIKKIGVLTDTGHHDHPASACVDQFREVFQSGGSKVLISNHHLKYLPEEKRSVKDWQSLLGDLSE